LSNSINPPFICAIKSSPPTKSAPAFFASSNFSPIDIKAYFKKSQITQKGNENNNYHAYNETRTGTI
jgi:hypothetical protein